MSETDIKSNEETKATFKKWKEEKEKKRAQMGPSLSITYFPVNGRGAALRAACIIGGISYEDNIITFDQLPQQKQDGLRRWSGIPEITIYNKQNAKISCIGQSNTCLRYIGTITGLYPTNPLQAALVDEILDSVEDIIKVFAFIILKKNQKQHN